MVFRNKVDMSMWLPKPDETMFEYWTSFSPMAPVFGVPWRFTEGLSGPVTRVGGTPRPAAKPVGRPVVVDMGEPAPKRKPKPAPQSQPPKAKTTDSQKPKTRSKAPVKPKAAAKSKPATVAVQDLTAIKGIGPKMAAKLAEKGITSYAQIAGWNAATVRKMDAELGGLPGAIKRQNWVAQAKSLAKA